VAIDQHGVEQGARWLKGAVQPGPVDFITIPSIGTARKLRRFAPAAPHVKCQIKK
jgi:hypothetical protein